MNLSNYKIIFLPGGSGHFIGAFLDQHNTNNNATWHSDSALKMTNGSHNYDDLDPLAINIIVDYSDPRDYVMISLNAMLKVTGTSPTLRVPCTTNELDSMLITFSNIWANGYYNRPMALSDNKSYLMPYSSGVLDPMSLVNLYRRINCVENVPQYKIDFALSYISKQWNEFLRPGAECFIRIAEFELTHDLVNKQRIWTIDDVDLESNWSLSLDKFLKLDNYII